MTAVSELVPDSDESGVDLVDTSDPDPELEEHSSPQSALSHRFRGSPEDKPIPNGRTRQPARQRSIAIIVPRPKRPWEYKSFNGDRTVDSVLEEIHGPDGSLLYRIDYENGKEEIVTYDQLRRLSNGQNALDFFNNDFIGDSEDEELSSEDPEMSLAAGKRNRNRPSNPGFTDSSAIPPKSDSDEDHAVTKKRLLGSGRASAMTNYSTRHSSRLSSGALSRTNGDESSDSEPTLPKRRTTRASNQPPLRLINKSSKFTEEDDESDEVDELAGDLQDESEGSDIIYKQPSQRKRTLKNPRGRKGRHSRYDDDSDPDSPEKPQRQSGRVRVKKSMKEQDMDEEIYADDVPIGPEKVISIREVYQPVSKESPFRIFHNSTCDVCGGVGQHSNKGKSYLIYCQGCSTSIHKICLGYRSGRDHMVTKVGHENFVMQCRRCIGVATKNDKSAPRLDVCQGCNEPGLSCAAFSLKKTAKQEEKLREENDGDDPITDVSEDLVNNAENVLFRCISCYRSYHFEHLPALSPESETPENVDELREERFKEYHTQWQCKECIEAFAKVQSLVAWRPVEKDIYTPGQTADDFSDDQKEFLIKWENKSYFKCTWMPGAWVWGITSASMRKAFFRRDEGNNLLPKWTNTEAIPEEYLRIEIVFKAHYGDGFSPRSKSADKAAISMVEEVFVKFQGLSYDESVWEEPPEPEDEARWSDFVAAYNEYVAGKYFRQESTATFKERIEDYRLLDFAAEVELKKQPSALIGGKMMEYQMEGLNWLLYNYHRRKNVILADEMGLGKTIQIISLLVALVKDKPKCWPFLVVTPNSTCPNWRREIKKWAPSLRVVSYYGPKKGRDMAMKYELYPDGCSDLRAHVVVTSYEAPVDDHSKSFFRKIKWAGLIVDEGQRLKNDANLLYIALQALKIPFQVLLTGTPLQNNKRELFNLLQFLDKTNNAAELDEKYAELTKENLSELHDLIRPYFLRRTKVQVLKFLPPMAQIIIPVTMSLVQKKLYKSIVSKNDKLIQSIFEQTTTVIRPKERGNLNNILMQLRKCLCHPFLYSRLIEERSLDNAALHRNLVDASSKFQLLEIMLPKLRDRGHRVLMFSQFLENLDLVEDLLTGLDLPFQRLDGSIGALEKQKRIDNFNAPDSELFAFLLSTRAGGVGINLATADTVIIMDPDFNPHQDIQALSRAHRIGQKKKVLVFQLLTKDSVEEKIAQIGRKKMALDHALIESMGAEDDENVDLESILKHGVQALFSDDHQNDIRYDSAKVDELLDRTQAENTNTDDEKTAESQFSFARVWANDTGTLTEGLGDADAEVAAPNLTFWDNILKEREANAAAEAASKIKDFGRGKRSRQAINYKKNELDLDEAMADSPEKRRGKRRLDDSASDMDFAAAVDSDVEEDSDFEIVDVRELQAQQDQQGHSRGVLASSGAPAKESTHRAQKSSALNKPTNQHPPYQPPNRRQFDEAEFQAWFDNSGLEDRRPSSKLYSDPKDKSTGGPDIQHSANNGRTSVVASSGSSQPKTLSSYSPANQPNVTSSAALSSFSSNNQSNNLGYSNNSSSSLHAPPIAQPDESGNPRRASVHPILPPGRYGRATGQSQLQPPQGTMAPICQLCGKDHVTDVCPHRHVQICKLCGIAHFGVSGACPSMATSHGIRILQDRLRKSTEDLEMKEKAKAYLEQQLGVKAIEELAAARRKNSA